MTIPQIIALIIAIIIVIFIGIFTYFMHKRKTEGREEAEKFLNSIKDALLEKLITIIKEFDYSKYDNLVGIEVDVLNKLKEVAKTFIISQVKSPACKLSLFCVKILLSEDTIDKFIDFIIDKLNVNTKVEEQLGDRYEKMYSGFEEEEKQLEETYNNPELYNEEDIVDLPHTNDNNELLDSDDNGLEERGFVLPSKKEEAELIPQSEEEEVYNPEDDSMELVKEEDDGTYYDSRGRLHDKSGKFIKMKK